MKNIFTYFQTKFFVAFALGVIFGTAVVGGFWAVEYGVVRDFFRDENAREAVDQTVSSLKIAFVSDWEYGYRRDLKHKLISRAPVELTKVVNFLNTSFHPDLVVGGGDYIESSSVEPERALEQLQSINQIFSLLDAPRLYALGNHDLRSLSKDQVVAALGIGDRHAVRDSGEWRIIVLDTNYNKKDDTHRNAEQYVTGYVSPEELQWLRDALRTDRPVIMFSHHSPIPVPNEEGGQVANITNAGDVRSVLEGAGNVVAVVSGHNPMVYYEERNGIHYFIVDTLVHEGALGSFATLDLFYAKERRYAAVSFRHHGENEAQYAVDREIGEAERNFPRDDFSEGRSNEDDEDETSMD